MSDHPRQDEYEWSKYSLEYANQMDEMMATAEENGSEFIVDKSEVTPEGIVFRDKLHSNWRELYSTIWTYKPASVYEAGCGGMYHLHNIKKLFPDIEVHGSDLLETQLRVGIQKLGLTDDYAKVLDFTSDDVVDVVKPAEFVFSHAVMMHLSKANAFKFLRNMLRVSTRYVFFIERRNKLDFTELLGDTGMDDVWFDSGVRFKSNATLLVRTM